jgi:hypothetical protein
MRDTCSCSKFDAKRGDHFLQADFPGLIVPGKLDGFRLADYALSDSVPSRPSPIGAERCEHSRIRLPAMQAQIANSLCLRENHPSR